MNKFNAKKLKTSEGTFDSRREYKRYKELKEMQAEGLITHLTRQVPFLLLPKQTGERKVEYVADFVYIIDTELMEEENKTLVVEDVKSKITKKDSTYILKRKIFKYNYITNSNPTYIEKNTGLILGTHYKKIVFEETL